MKPIAIAAAALLLGLPTQAGHPRILEAKSSCEQLAEAYLERLEGRREGGVLVGPGAEAQTLAREGLVALAGTSSEARRQVIATVTGRLGELLSDATADSGGVHVCLRVIGELRAEEAVDLLVRNIDFNNGTIGLSLGHWPATEALIQIGDPAVPALDAALALRTDGARYLIGTVLQQIGTESAREVLRRNFPNEHESYHRLFLEGRTGV